ncbi:MAG: MFS transporter [Oscillospiraceae bacterium]|nr:MFS transporter [Oscillospiraceae bacterium]
MIADYFEGAEQADVMGKQSAFINMGGMLIAFLGALLIGTGWRNVFFVFLYAIPVLLICLVCIPKDKTAVEGDVQQATEKSKVTLTGEVYVMCGMAMVIALTTLGVINTNSAILIAERGLGGPAIANFGTSVMTATGIVVGLLYRYIYKTCRHYTLPLAFIIFACGMVLMGNATSIPVFYLGSIAAGIGLASSMPTGLSRCAQASGPGSATFAISMFLSAYMVAAFLSPMIMNPVSHLIANGTAQSRYNIGFVTVVALSLLALFHVRRVDAKKQADHTALQ